jgi:hypothetical protein
MRTPYIPVLVLAALPLSACDDAKPSAASAPSATLAPSTSAAAPPSNASASAASSAALPKCPPGLTGNAVPAYCIKLPTGYSVKEARIAPTRGSIDYQTGTTTDNLMVSYDDSPIATTAKDTESEMKFGSDKLEKKGDLPGGNKFFQGSHEDFERVVTVVKAGALTLKCSFTYQPKHAPPADAIDACKSIVLP